ncbi:MAG: dTMP kinase [Bacillota bacterium]
MKSAFITFEGTDGAGKSTQLRRLVDYYKVRGTDVVITREPGGTSLAEEIRNLLLDPGKKVVGPAEVLLYAAARAQHVEQLIKPALVAGKTVLCDRFIDSSVAYQGFGRGLPINTIMEVNHFASGGLEPDLTIVLDLSYDQAMSRIALRTSRVGLDRIEQEQADFHRRVREGFLWLREKFPQRVKLIDASLPQEVVFAKIIEELQGARLVD